MDKKEKKKVENLDDLLNSLKDEHSKNLDESFKAFDEFTKEDNQLHLYNNIFTPAQQELYNGVVGELDKVFEKDDTASIHNKEKEIKKAVVSGLKKYFGKVQPSITQAIEDLGMDDEEAYEHLVGHYDRHVGADGKKVKSIGDLADLARNKKGKVGHVKKVIPELTQNHIESAMNHLINKYGNHHFSKYHGIEIASYLKPKLEKEGFEIDDKVGFAQGELNDMLELRKKYLLKKEAKYLKKPEEKKK